MREIVTIQVGDFANFVGCHFWNFQDELLGLAVDRSSDPIFSNQSIDMDVLYRTGETPQGILTYTPRLLSVDLPGSLGSMSSQGTLYNELPPASSSVCTWTGNLSTHVSEPCKKNLFLQRLQEDDQESSALIGVENGKNDCKSDISDNDVVESLDRSVQFWTDFSKVHYHPLSLFELNGTGVDTQNFKSHGIGKDALLGIMQVEEMNERLRFFVEECDHIQGIQLLVDDSGSYSFVAADFLENIADEYANTPLLLFSLRGPRNYINTEDHKQMIVRNLHDAVSFSRLSSFSSLIVPVGLPNLSSSEASRFHCMKSENPYHCSAVYASALHSISLPFRMELPHPATHPYNVYGGIDVNGILQVLTGQARQSSVAVLDVSMPAPSLIGTQFEHSVLNSLQPLTPEVADDLEDLLAVESLTILGALESELNRASVSKVKEAVHSAYEHSTHKPKSSHLSVSRCPLPIPLPFPPIFGNLLSSRMPGSSSRGLLNVCSIPIAARLRSSVSALPFLENRLGYLRTHGIDRGGLGREVARGWGFERDELVVMEENLLKMVRELQPGSDTSSGSD